MPRRRRVWRKGRLVYPLSAMMRLGRRLGRPRPGRLTAPWSSSWVATVISCCCPGVSRKVRSLPFRSVRTWSLVLNPPRLRPKASAFALLFLPQRRADGRESPCHPGNVPPNPTLVLGQRPAGERPERAPRCQLDATVGSDCRRCSTSHTVPVSHARVRPCVLSTAFRSPSCGVHGHTAP